MSFFENKRYIWLPAVLLIFALVIAWIYRPSKVANPNYTVYYGTLIGEIVVVIALSFVIKKRDKLRREREDDIKKTKNDYK